MKLAIFHNFLNNIGGAERVTLTLARELKAAVVTTVANKKMIAKMGFDLPITEIGWIPNNPPWRQQLASLRFRLLNLSTKYDAFLIAGDWALSGAVHNKPSLWYCHTPSRELWDLKDYTRTYIVPPHKRLAYDAWVALNRTLNRRYVTQATTIVASSGTAQRRLKRYLHVTAPVIHPPVDTRQYRYQESGSFWLSVNRLVRYKRIELQLEAFRAMPEQRLVIVGSYEQSRHFREYVAYLKQIKPPNVTFLHWVDGAKLKELYATCRGFITTSQGEDFGLTAVEAMASGKPVVAPAAGGYLETVIDQRTGLLLPEEIAPEALVTAVRQLSPQAASFQEACVERARDFDTSQAVPRLAAALAQLH